MSATLKGTDGALQRDVDSVKDGISDLALRIDKLRSIVNKQISENKVGACFFFFPKFATFYTL